MNELPPGWEWATTCDLFTFVTSGSRGWARYYSEEGAPFIRVGNLPRGSIRPDFTELQRVSPPVGSEGSRTRIQTNDILISITADLGRVALMSEVREDSYINQHVALGRPVKEINASYLAWYLSSDAVQRQWVKQQRGATKLGLGLDDVRSITVPLPPRPEQDAIVATIEEQFSRLDAGTASLQSAKRRIPSIRASIIQSAVSGALTGDSGSLRETGLPVGWKLCSIDEISASSRNSLAIGPFGSNLKVSDYTTQGVPLIFVRQVRSAVFGGAGSRFVSKEKADELRAHSARAGDVLITKMGEPPGDATVYPSGYPDAIITADVIKLSVRDGVAPEYVALAVNSKYVRDQFISITRGVAQQKVSLARLRQSVRIPMPPNEEQLQIVREVSWRMQEVDRMESAIEVQLLRSSSLRSSILKDAFAGKLASV